VKPYIVGDGAFALSDYMLKCYDVENLRRCAEFNCRLCDTCKLVECAFGRLKMKWQFCHGNEWHNDPTFVSECIQACVCLHNFLIDERESFDDELLDRFLAEIRNEADPHVAEPEGNDANQSVRDFLSYYMLQFDE
jgi:hypothetical protein